MCTIDIILELLVAQGKTQKELCDAIGIKKQTFSNWKSRISSSYTKYLPQIANFFNVSVDYLLETNKNAGEKEKSALKLSTLPDNYIIYHRDGKNTVVKFNEAQKKILEALISTAQTEDIEE